MCVKSSLPSLPHLLWQHPLYLLTTSSLLRAHEITLAFSSKKVDEDIYRHVTIVYDPTVYDPFFFRFWLTFTPRSKTLTHTHTPTHKTQCLKLHPAQWVAQVVWSSREKDLRRCPRSI